MHIGADDVDTDIKHVAEDKDHREGDDVFLAGHLRCS